MQNPLWLVAVVVLFALPCSAYAAPGAPAAAPSPTPPAKRMAHPKIESVQGARTVLVQRGLELRELEPGEDVSIGERIRTDQKTKVIVAYDDGSKLVVYPGSDLEITEPKNHVQGVELRGGNVEGLIQKAPDAKTYADASRAKPEAVTGKTDAKGKAMDPKKPVKFVIRTKTAVMGVRGTDFVAAFDAVRGLAQFNTLEGSIEVATNPAQLMSGQGVPVGSGQFVQATADAGISVAKSFNTATFLQGLEAGASSSTLGSALTSAAGSAGSTAAGAGQSLASSVASQVSTPKLPSSSPQPAPAPKNPEQAPPPTPEAVAQKKADEEAEKPKMHLISFGIGGFRSKDPVTSQYKTAFNLTWTPSIPLPWVSFLYVRGSFGAVMFEGFSLRNALIIHEYQLLGGISLLKPRFLEFGGGEQIWRQAGTDGMVLTANTGLILSQNGKLNRIYVGASRFFQGNQPFELRVGVGLQIF